MAERLNRLYRKYGVQTLDRANLSRS